MKWILHEFQIGRFADVGGQIVSRYTLCVTLSATGWQILNDRWPFLAADQNVEPIAARPGYIANNMLNK